MSSLGSTPGRPVDLGQVHDRGAGFTDLDPLRGRNSIGSSGNLDPMSGLFGYREHTDPWFRIGRLEVSTTVFVVLALAASVVPWVVLGKAWIATTAYLPTSLAQGQLWRLFTWPFAEGLSIYAVLNALMLWYFGTMLEGQIGRKSMARLLIGIWATSTITYSLAAYLLPAMALYGVGTIEFMLVLVWIAEYPKARFFFNIPAWGFGVVILALSLLQPLGYGDYATPLALVLAMAPIAIIARSTGLLTAYRQIPGARRVRKPKAPKVPRAEAKKAERRVSDRQRLDDLLDQINEQGIHSLTESQRKELKKLSDRRRNS